MVTISTTKNYGFFRKWVKGIRYTMMTCSLMVLSLGWVNARSYIEPSNEEPAKPTMPDQYNEQVNGAELIWQQGESPIIEVVFVLDTTGSMSGLIEGAKRKIWSIATNIIQAQQTPTIRMGLVGYRDRGDQYITVKHDLTEDVDSMYSSLMQLEAAGGGDGPESVNQALYEGIHLMPWSNDPRALQIVFLVGDFPPHMDYQDDVHYPITARTAQQKGIIINTIQCGNHQPTTKVWQDIAKLGQGQYVALSQTGNMTAITTPYDQRISELTTEQSQTFLNYGDRREKAAFAAKQSSRRSASVSAQADRAEYRYRGDGNVKLYTGSKDLVEAVKEEGVDLDEVETEALPEAMQTMNPAERAAYVNQNYAKRQKLDAELQSLLEQRSEYLRQEEARLAAKSKQDSFDAKVAEIVRQQAAGKGIAY